MHMLEPVTPEVPVPALFLELFDRRAAERGDENVLMWDGGALTWRDLHRQANDVAAALLDSGGLPRQRAAVAGLASADYVATFIGILKAGMSVVPLSTTVTADVAWRLLQDSGARFVFADRDSAAQLQSFDPGADVSSIPRRFAFEDGIPGCESFRSWRDRARSPVQLPAARAHDEFNVIYSSGTTGTPKGIVHDQLIRALQVQAFQGLGVSQQTLTILTTPLYTNYTLVALLATLGSGGKVYLMPRFREEAFLAVCRALPITHAFLVPPQIKRLLDHSDFDRSIRDRPMTVVSAGSPLPLKRKQEVLDRWPGVLLEIYGATEGGASTVLVATQFRDKLGSVGRASAGNDIRIISDGGDELPVGQIGEIVGRSMMMRGYLNREAETRALIWTAPSGEQYLRSGDVGYLDADGFLYLTDRKKDIIISGGMNVFASDLEEVLRNHAAVAECAVVGAASERWGETPVAFVIPASRKAPTESELLAWANERLSKHQRLDRVIYRDSLPRNAMGKIVKKDLRLSLQQ